MCSVTRVRYEKFCLGCLGTNEISELKLRSVTWNWFPIKKYLLMDFICWWIQTRRLYGDLMQICASLNYRKKKKAQPCRLIPWKLTVVGKSLRCRVFKRTPQSFDLSKIRTNSQKMCPLKFRHFLTILIKLHLFAIAGINKSFLRNRKHLKYICIFNKLFLGTWYFNFSFSFAMLGKYDVTTAFHLCALLILRCREWGIL